MNALSQPQKTHSRVGTIKNGTKSGPTKLQTALAIMLKEMRLPAAVAKVVLSGAVQDFIDEARPTDDADWLSLVRAARTATRDRVEDYIAAATAAGPFVPDAGRRLPERP